MNPSDAGAANHTAIIVAIVGFASALLGATIGAVTNYIIAKRQERSEREQEERVRAVGVKRAARLIDQELLLAQALARMAVTERHWVAAAEISTEVWKTHCGTIAPELSDDAWHLVTTAFLAAEHIKWGRGLYLEGNLLRDQPISDEAAGQISVMLRDVQQGRAALAPYAKIAPNPTA
jgi:hypothetical protein